MLSHPRPSRAHSPLRDSLRALPLASIRALLLLSLTGAVAPDAAAQDRVLTVTTDYASGSVSFFPVNAPWTPQPDLEPVCADATARVHDGLVYAINRYGCDNIQVIDPSTWTTLREFSVGAQTNPQDIVVIGPSRAYVSRYETNDLLEVDPSSGAVLGTISLASFADADGLCEMHRMIRSGDRLFVQVQRMFRQAWPDPWLPSPPSQLVVIDLATRQIVDVDPASPGVQGIALAGLNPIAPMQLDPHTGDILVPLAGRYGVTDAGGVERVDPVALASRGFAVTEAVLGGDLIDFALWSPDRAYAIVSDASFTTILEAWNPSTGQLLGVVYNPGSYELSDLLTYPTGWLFVADRDYVHPGIRIYHAATGTQAGGPFGTGLPPFELTLLPAAASPVPEPEIVESGPGGAGPCIVLEAPRPNPAAGGVTIPWRSLAGAPAPGRLIVQDVHGRQVRLLPVEGRSRIFWDGRDDAGAAVPSGVYWIRVAGEAAARGARSVRILR